MTRSSQVLLSTAVVLFLGAASAKAQDLESLRFDAPFQFQVGSATLPAGTYELRLDEQESPGIVRVRSESGGEAAFALSDPVDVAMRPAAPRVVFREEGTRYVLARVVDPGAAFGVELEGVTLPTPERKSAELHATLRWGPPRHS
jgi:hypothetical protein